MARAVVAARDLPSDPSLDSYVERLRLLRSCCQNCITLVEEQVRRKSRKPLVSENDLDRLRRSYEKIGTANDWGQAKQWSSDEANGRLKDFIVTVSDFVVAIEEFLRDKANAGGVRRWFKSKAQVLPYPHQFKKIQVLAQQMYEQLSDISILYVKLRADIFFPKPLSRSGSDHSTLEKQFPVFSYSLEGLQTGMGSRSFNVSLNLRENISHGDYRIRHERYRSQCLQKTCQWIFLNSTYKQWTEESSPTTLWLTGLAGCGKSVLSSQIIDKLARSHDGQVAYFYMAPGKSQRALDVGQSIIAQLDVNKTISAPSTTYGAGFLVGYRSKDQSFEQMLQSLDRLSGSLSGTTYIVIDALDDDNLSSPDDFHRLLERFLSKNWKLFLTRRPGGSCVDEWRLSGASKLINIDRTVTLDDITLLIKGALQNYRKTHANSPLSQELESEVEEHVRDASDGIFLKVALDLDDILQQHTVARIRRALQKPNRNVTALEKIERLPSDQRDLAKKALVWVANMTWPLRTAGLCEALAIGALDADHSFDDYKELIPIEDSVIGFCESLITRDASTETVVLAHQGIRNMINERWLSSTVPVSVVSLNYLLLPDFASKRCGTEEELENVLGTYQFLDYAAHSWFSANDEAEEKDLVASSNLSFVEKRSRKDLLLALLRSRRNLELALLIVFRSKAFIEPSNNAWDAARARASTTTNIHATACYGLPVGILETLLNTNKTSSLTEQDSLGRTPLHEAARKGHANLIRNLLSEKAFSTLDIFHRLPIHYAFEKARTKHSMGNFRRQEDFMEILRCLLQAHANWLMQGLSHSRANSPRVRLLDGVANRDDILSFFRTSNQYYIGFSDAENYIRAARDKDLAMVMVLLEHGVNPNTGEDDKKLPALHLAISTGSRDPALQVVRSMLANNADASIVDRGMKRQSALQRAIDLNLPSIAQELLPRLRKEHVDHLDSSKQSALCLAVRKGSVELVQLLLEQGADPDVSNPLSYAVQQEYTTIVQLLLEHKANPDLGNPLLSAVKMKSAPIAQLLLEHTANPDNGIPLLCAVQQDSTNLTQLLLKHNASPNKGDVLFHAVKRGSIPITRLLLEHGADPNAGNTLLTAVQRSCVVEDLTRLAPKHEASASVGKGDVLGHDAIQRDEYAAIVQLLLEHGAKAQSGSPLVCAVRNGDMKIVRLLLEHGAPTHTDDASRPTVLFDALTGRGAMMELLLTSQVDIDKPDDQGQNVLFHAVRQRKQPMVKILLKSGVDLTVKAGTGKNQDILTAARDAGDAEILQTIALWLPRTRPRYSTGEFGQI